MGFEPCCAGALKAGSLQSVLASQSVSLFYEVILLLYTLLWYDTRAPNGR